MPSRHLLAVALSGVLLSGVVVTGPVASAAPAPGPEQLVEAQRRVADAQQGLADLQERASVATEAYNDAQVTADAAAAAAQQAEVGAAQAQSVAVVAGADAAAAEGLAGAAAAAARDARAASDRSTAAVVAAQSVLDDIASGAYRSGGSLVLLSTMLAADPMSFATGQAMINRVDEHQRDSLDALTQRRADAAATAQADSAQVAATTTARAVAERAADAVDAAQAAAPAASVATSAAATSVAAASQAATARQQALVLVEQAERLLGSVNTDAATLTAQAEQARREAAAVRRDLPGATSVTGSAAAAAIDRAFTQIGVPYSWGGGGESGPTYGILQGAGTKGFDCSGLMIYAWAPAGVRLDHSSRSQYSAGRHVAFEQLVPGDLIFYATDTSRPTTIHHVTMYVGGGKMIEAPHTGSVVRVSTVYRRGFIGGTRLTGS